jgi:hypothetical protein
LGAGADSVLDAESVLGAEESSAQATPGVIATAPPIPRAIARAPTRPMYLDEPADNMVSLSYGLWLRM